MTTPEMDNGTTRDDLLQRVALMETMITEGRRNTGRYGWIFILWGLVCLSGVGWSYLQPHGYWVWPIVIACGFAIQFVGIAMQRRRGHWSSENIKSRSVAAVWRMMSIAIILYVTPAIVTHTIHQIAYIAAIFMFLGMAHATSAVILRWGVQGMVAGLWWAGGVATYFVPRDYVITIYMVEMVCCMVLFGVYAMMLERRRAAALVQVQVQHHA
jgi:hypothetical protein